LLTTFKQGIKELKLIPSGGGCFELSADGKRVYSKLETESSPTSSRSSISWPPGSAEPQGMTMLFFGRKKRLTDYASCAG